MTAMPVARSMGALIIAVLLFACASPGTGPITLTRDASEFFRKQSARRDCTDYFLSEDGASIACDYCPTGSSCSHGFRAHPRCESESGKKCHLFARGGRIVWEGPVTFTDAGPGRAERRYKPPRIGLRIDTDRGHFTVTGVDGFAIRTSDANGRPSTWCGGTFQIDAGTMVQEYGSGRNRPACAPDVHEEWWSLGIRGWAQFREVSHVADWGSTITYLGQDQLQVDGRSYLIEKFEHARAAVRGGQPFRYFHEILWYSPEVGFVLRRDVHWRDGREPTVEAFRATRIVPP